MKFALGGVLAADESAPQGVRRLEQTMLSKYFSQPAYQKRKKVMRLVLTSISLLLLPVLLASLFFWPNITPWISLTLLVVSFGMTIYVTGQKHWKSYLQAECTREKMVRNLTLDILGFLLTMGAAMYAGGMAGGYLGLRAGLWIGLLAGLAGGFLAAWLVRSMWGKLVLARISAEPV
jgi:hypothetical protein